MPRIGSSDDPGDVEDEPFHLFASRYLLQQSLKSGNSVDTFLAIDTLTDDTVVLKSIVPGQNHDAARLRFEHETQVLRQLSGIGLTGLHDAGVANDQWYLVQPYVPGTTLEQLLTDGPLALETVLRIGIDVVSALDIAHSAGIFHRDVKPANVMVDGIDPVGSVTLIDFGFARSPLLDASIGEDLVGTVRYLAPEAAGMLTTEPDERADLYAVGIMLFESIAGHPPFSGDSAGEVLREHLSMPVPDLRQSRHGIPRALVAILQRVLSKDPVDRYQSAAALAFDLQALLLGLQDGDPDPHLVVGQIDHRRTLTDPVFVGREGELGVLTSLVADVLVGGSGLVLLESDSGGGKTRLLAEIASQAAYSGLTLLRGQGVAETGRRPFALLQDFADDLVSHAVADEALRLHLWEGIGDGAEVVAQVLPTLGPLLEVVDTTPTGPERFGEQRSLMVLHRLFHSIGTAEHPVLVVLDDCQWADGLAIKLLTKLFAAGIELPHHVGVIAAFRTEEVPADHPLRQVAVATYVQLAPLSARAMTELTESMAGPLPPQAISTVVRLAGGSPFMGAAVLRGLFESGAIISNDDGWEVDATALRDVQTARRSVGSLVRRLELLSDDSIQVLSAGAALGKEFDFLMAVELVDQTEAAAAILQEAGRRRLVWVDDRTGRCIFAHDKIREALLHRLDPATRRDLHGRAADLIQRQGADDLSVFDLAHHLDAAGRHQAALPYALRAAALARGQSSLDSALEHYRMAQRGVDDADLETRILIAEQLGEILILQGAYEEAEHQLELACELVDDRVHQASIEGKLGSVAFKQGDVVTARRHLEGAMARLGRRVPRVPFLVPSLIWEIAVQVLHTMLPRLLTGRRDPAGRQEDFLAVRLHSSLAHLYWCSGGKTACAWSHLRGLNLAERYPTSAELGQALSEHAPVMTMVPLFGRALRYAEKSFEVRRDHGDKWGQGQSQSFVGVTLYAASRFDEAETAYRQAIELLGSSGDRREVNTVGWNLAMCLYRKGQLTDAMTTAQSVYESAVAIGDHTSAGVGLSVWTRAAGGMVDGGLIEAELCHRGEDASTTAVLRLAAGLHALHHDDLDEAAAQLAVAAATIRAAGLRQEYVAPVACWVATVARIRAERVSVHDPGERARLVRTASRAVMRARMWSWSYRNNAPHALRDAGLLASLKGRTRRMDKLLSRSLQVAEAQGALYEAALTREAIARTSHARGADGSALAAASIAVREMETPRDEVDVVPAALSVSVLDRFTTLLDVGRTITAAQSALAVHAAVREAALTLLRGETCHVVQAQAVTRTTMNTESGEPIDDVSRTLLIRAIQTGVPVLADDSPASESESLVRSGVRSVLAAPIVVHGETQYCFYVTHHQISQLFGEEEAQLAAIVATLAGAALEHLVGTETRYRSLAQNSSDVLTLVDRNRLVSYQSSAASRVFALPSPGLVGRPVADWVHPDDLLLFTDALDRARLRREVRIECRFLHADGSYLYTETAVTDLLDDPHVNALVLNSRDVTDRRRLEDELRERALHDGLTGLPNRALFLDRAQHALNRREHRPLVVCFLDLDDFKAVNDTYGHAAGDELLREMGRRLLQCLRPEDVVSRFGGDEFAILLEDTTLQGALAVVERILTSTSAPVRISGYETVTHFSIGVASSSGEYSTPDQLLAEADVAMYAAKARGSHLYSVFEPHMRVSAESRSLVRGELENAVGNQELRLHFQPIVDLATHRTAGVEALVRWQHPERGLLMPADFIDLAESTGQISGIGEWVIDSACRAGTTLTSGGLMSINVSARQLHHGGLVETIRSALGKTGFAADRLVLEITETTAVANMDSALAQLTELKTLGVQLALDDFGTGYSTLNYLRRFPIDFVKIDLSFVHSIVTSSKDRAIVRGVVELAHSFGVRAIAEGIENEEQRTVVTDLGCDLGQGFLWTRARPAVEQPLLFKGVTPE